MNAIVDPPSPEPANWTDIRPLLDRELEKLPAKYRAPVILCDLEGETRQEAARRLGWPEGTLCSRLFAGRKKLRARLSRRGLTLSGGVLTVTLVEQASGHVPSDLVGKTIALVSSPSSATCTATILAQKVIHAMTISKSKLVAAVFVVLGLVGGGTLLVPASGEDPKQRDRTSVRAASPADADLALKGHTGSVFGVAFSPDGKQIASASFDHTAKIWDTKTGKEIVTLKGHTMPVLAVVFEPDGKHVWTVASPFYGDQITEPGEVWRWDAQTGEQLKKLSGHKVSTFAVAVSPDGTRIAAVGGIGTESELDVWDARSGKILFNFRSEAVLPFMAVDFSPDGKAVAVGGGRRVYGVDATTGKLLFESAEHPDPVYATVFSPDGAHIASAGSGKPPGIRLWDGRTGKKLPMIETSQRSIKSLAYSRDGAKIASAAFDGTARIFDVATGAELVAREI